MPRPRTLGRWRLEELAGTVTYHTQSPAPWIEVRTRVDADAFLTSLEIFNALGEHVFGFEQADTVADGAPWVLRDWTERDDDGRIRQVRRPWLFSTDPTLVANNALSPTPIGTPLSTFYDPLAIRN